MSIRTRMTLWYTAVLTATLLLFGSVLYSVMRLTLYRDLRQELRETSYRIYSQISAEQLPFLFGGQIVLRLPNLNAFQSSNIFIQLVGADGRLLDKSANLGRQNIPLLQAHFEQAAQGRPFYASVDLPEVRYRLLLMYTPLMVDGRFVAVLQVGGLTDDIEAFLRKLSLILVATAAVGVLVAATFGSYLARKALKPIDVVIEAANRIQEGRDLGLRIPRRGPNDEIGRLTDTINGMLERIQAAYEELDHLYRMQRRFVSDASHELRTPLTTIRGNIEFLEKVWSSLSTRAGLVPADGEQGGRPEGTEMPDEETVRATVEAMRDIASEAERMSRLINDLLSLARADAGYRMHKEPVELKPVVEEVVRKAQMLPRSAEWIVGDLSTLDGLFVHGNRDYLQQLLFIFIDNAFKYTPSGEVELSIERMGDRVGFRIRDTGIGMDKDDVPHIFERFYRADVSRGRTAGTGLGLAIAKWILDEHGGSVEVLTGPGRGTTFVVWLPLWFPPANDSGIMGKNADG